MTEKRYVLDAHVAQQKLHRMALEIAERTSGDSEPLILIGVRNSGSVIAARIADFLQPYINVPVTVTSVKLDKHNPSTVELADPIDVDDKNIIVIDDVCNTGKTLLYSMKALLDHHPKRIQTLVLVDRMHKLFPVKPDYIGLSLATTSQDFIHVESENGEVTGAYIGQ
ncbi:phosphoribosyltransferase family protein [Foetidibacter luteolus]|uniref:phosphoribosyltransferase family protein n=1 Tax=Foetidibacter luteolus TaxID=2608880 RepID=UPI00129AA4A3|nr:phosphoribosyltransferase family protein [Foetidibacter luteolus]